MKIFRGSGNRTWNFNYRTRRSNRIPEAERRIRAVGIITNIIFGILWLIVCSIMVISASEMLTNKADAGERVGLNK